MFCSQCGTQTPDDAAFCQKCGAAIAAGDVQAEGAAPQADRGATTSSGIARRYVKRPPRTADHGSGAKPVVRLYVRGTSAPIFGAPTGAAKVLFPLKGGQAVRVLGEEGAFYRVALDEAETRWFIMEYDLRSSNAALERAATPGVVNVRGASAPVYEAPSSAAKVLLRLEKGQAIHILSKEGAFYRICPVPSEAGWFMRRDDLRSAGTASSHVAAGTSARSASTAQNIIGVIVVVGAALAIIGCLLPWTGRRISPANAFDQGYITGDGYWSYSDNPGNDGVIILAAALGAGALGVHYFIRRNALAGLGVLGLGVSVAAVAGFNLGKIIQAVNELYGSATEGVGDGVYLTVAGGVIIAVAALVGLLQSAALAGAGAESSAYSPAQPARGGMKGSCALCGKTGLDADEIRVLDDGRWACQHCATTQAMQ